jgi:hypothetical protein
MKPADEVEEDGNKALAHNCAITMTVRGFGEKDIHLVGVILAAKGYYALDMRDIAHMAGIKDPNGEKYHADDWGSDDGVTKKEDRALAGS